MKIQSHNLALTFLMLPLFLMQGFFLYAQEDALANGKKIFQTNCGACHAVQNEVIGPALASITKKRSMDWLTSFIKNSQYVIASGDEYANFLAQKFDYMVMPSFTTLSDEEIKNILVYIEKESQVSSKEFNEIEETNYTLEYDNPDILRGKDLFVNQCSSCHSVHKENYGPALGSVAKRKSKTWLMNFIRNSQKVIKTGDKYSVFLFEKFDKKVMVPMEFLSENEIDDILKYVTFKSKYQMLKKSNPAVVSTSPANANGYVESKSGIPFFIAFFICIASIGAIIQGFLIVKLYRYLAEE